MSTPPQLPLPPPPVFLNVDNIDISLNMEERSYSGFDPQLKWQKNFLLQSWLSVLTFVSVSVPPLCHHGIV